MMLSPRRSFSTDFSKCFMSKRGHVRFCASDIRVRFAPSPTGQLHVGGLRTALYNYLFARSRQGAFLLRIEDTDQSRLVKQSVSNIIMVSVQMKAHCMSQRLDLYYHHAEQLIESGRAYRCFCTPQRLELLRKEAARTNKVPKYDMRCRSISAAESAQRAQNFEEYVVRFKLDVQDVTFKDEVFGAVTQTIDESDPILLKNDRFPTYHFANVVDDKAMRISHVIRGMEWLSSTGKHAILYKAFNWTPPLFAHLPLLTRDGRKKLSKRDADAFVNYYHQKRGFLPQAVLNLLIRNGSGIRDFDPNHLYSLEEMVQQFDLSLIGRRNLQVDSNFLEHYGRLAFRKATVDELLPQIKMRVAQDLPGSEDICDNRAYMEKVINFLHEKEENFSSLDQLTSQHFRFFFCRPKSAHQVQSELAASILQNILELPAPWEISKIRNVADHHNTKHQIVYKTIRIALTGYSTGPPVLELYEFLGHDEVHARIQSMLVLLSGNE